MKSNIEFKEYAKDIKLNLSSILKNDSESSLEDNQIFLISLACAYASKESSLVDYVLEKSKGIITDKEVSAAKAAASIMAMNNVYYRFIHFVSDPEYIKVPAKLRMNIIRNPGVKSTDFELCSLAVSAINGCGLCIDSHTKKLVGEGVDRVTITHTIRIASVISAVAQTIFIN